MEDIFLMLNPQEEDKELLQCSVPTRAVAEVGKFILVETKPMNIEPKLLKILPTLIYLVYMLNCHCILFFHMDLLSLSYRRGLNFCNVPQFCNIVNLVPKGKMHVVRGSYLP